MSTRRILHHGPSPLGTPVLLSDRAIGGCWFELHRQGGCGAGELILHREFQERAAIEIGDWISCEGAIGQRWYLGRVEECRFQLPGVMRLRLAGMSIELNEVFPGGFEATPDERRPLRYGDTDLFSNDPDRDWEVAHTSPTIESLVRQLIQHHVVNRTHISYVSALIEPPLTGIKALSAKFRGEESLRSILKDLALRAQASWGVDALGRFFFIRRRSGVQSTFQLGQDVTSLEETRDRELIFNRLLLTGDYIYDRRDNSGQIARRVFRWRASYFEPQSCQVYGNRRLRLWVPWIRTEGDSKDFAREFFRIYAKPTARYAVETVPHTTLLIPWDGPVEIKDSQGAVLTQGVVDKVRVLFDHAPRFRMEVGPEDPREQWPEPPQDERWELPDHIPSNGGEVSVTQVGDSGGGGGDGGHSSLSTSSSQWPPEESTQHSSNFDSTGGSTDLSVETSADQSWSTRQSYSTDHHSTTNDFTSDFNHSQSDSDVLTSTHETSSDSLWSTDQFHDSTEYSTSNTQPTSMSGPTSQNLSSDSLWSSQGLTGLSLEPTSHLFTDSSHSMQWSTSQNPNLSSSGLSTTLQSTSNSFSSDDSIQGTPHGSGMSSQNLPPTSGSQSWTSLSMGITSDDTQHSFMTSLSNDYWPSGNPPSPGV